MIKSKRIAYTNFLKNAFLSKILVYVSKTFKSAKNDYRNLSFFSLVFYLSIHFFSVSFIIITLIHDLFICILCTLFIVSFYSIFLLILSDCFYLTGRDLSF